MIFLFGKDFQFFTFYLLLALTLKLIAANGTFYRASLGSMQLRDGENCDTMVTQQEGHLVTPLHPDRYRQFSDCLYTIKRYSSDVCMVKLIIEFFEVFHTENCSHDYLILQSGHMHYRLCGTISPGTKKYLLFPENSDSLIFKFKSVYLREYGFSISVKQLRNSCANMSDSFQDSQGASCNREIRGRWGRITSPSYPNNYKVGEKCVYKIYRSEPTACNVELDILQFDVTPSSMCSKDFLHLPDGSRLCGTIGSMKKSLVFPADQEYLTLLFMSDMSEGKGKGFNIQVNQFPGPCGTRIPKIARQCDQIITTSSGSFTSPGFPHSFGPNYRCTYIVRRTDPSVCQLELQFLIFDIGKHNPVTCMQGAYFELPGHILICQPFVGKKIIEISEFQEPTTFHFVSDKYSSGRGFEIKVSQIPNTCRGFAKDSPKIPDAIRRCYQEVSTEFGYFTPSKRPLESDSQEICEFIVKKFHPTVCSVQLQLSFPRLPIVPCVRNYILLPNGEKFCIEFSLSKQVAFPRGSDRIQLIYYGHDKAEFSVVVNQMKNSCPIPSELMFLNGTENQWFWKIKPR